MKLPAASAKVILTCLHLVVILIPASARAVHDVNNVKPARDVTGTLTSLRGGEGATDGIASSSGRPSETTRGRLTGGTTGEPLAPSDIKRRKASVQKLPGQTSSTAGHTSPDGPTPPADRSTPGSAAGDTAPPRVEPRDDTGVRSSHRHAPVGGRATVGVSSAGDEGLPAASPGGKAFPWTPVGTVVSVVVMFHVVVVWIWCRRRKTEEDMVGLVV